MLQRTRRAPHDMALRALDDTPVSIRWAALCLMAIAALISILVAREISSPTAQSGLHEMTIHAHSASGQSEASIPGTVVTPLSCEKLPNVPGKSITTVLVDFPPGAYSPRHRHPGSVTAFVLIGEVRSQLDGGPVGTFGVGQTWFEPPGTIHDFVGNTSATEPAQLLAIFIADNDCGPLTIFE